MHRILSDGGEEDEDEGEITSQVERPFLGTGHDFREVWVKTNLDEYFSGSNVLLMNLS